MPYSYRMNSRLYLLSLPSEILHKVLTHLECREMIKCRLVCGCLNKIITKDSELLYLIELTKNGLMDSGRTTVSVSYAERLNSLMDRNRAWQSLHWKNVATVDVRGPCTAYELVGGVFAKTNGRDLFLSWLPNASSPGHVVHIKDVGLQLRDFAIDPTQDLVVLLEENSTIFENDDLSRHVRLHLRTVSTMKPHPKAQLPELTLNIRNNHITAAFLQIATDILAVFLTLEFLTTRLVLWNWQDGQLISDSEKEEYEMPRTSWDFALISPRSFMITTTEDDGALMLYKFSYPDKPKPTHVVTLQMPALQDDLILLFLSSHSGPFLANPPHGTNFTTGPESRIQVLSVEYRNTDIPFGTHNSGFFYVHNKTFQEYIKRYSQTANKPTEIPWIEWGPENTQFSFVRSPSHWLRYVQGTRVVCPPDVRDGQAIMEVYDFNVLPGQKSRKLWRRPINFIFQSPLRTCLPYHSQICAVEEENYGAFMIDEERVIGLKVDPMNKENVVALHVYCF